MTEKPCPAKPHCTGPRTTPPDLRQHIVAHTAPETSRPSNHSVNGRRDEPLRHADKQAPPVRHNQSDSQPLRWLNRGIRVSSIMPSSSVAVQLVLVSGRRTEWRRSLSAPPPSKNRTCKFPCITAQAFQRAPLWGAPAVHPPARWARY